MFVVNSVHLNKLNVSTDRQADGVVTLCNPSLECPFKFSKLKMVSKGFLRHRRPCGSGLETALAREFQTWPFSQSYVLG